MVRCLKFLVMSIMGRNGLLTCHWLVLAFVFCEISVLYVVLDSWVKSVLWVIKIVW